MTKEQLRQIIGKNIREERLARNISVEEMADMLGLTAGFVGLIERGERGTTAFNLFILSNMLGVSIDSIFKSTNLDNESDATKSKFKKIESLMTNFTDAELNFVIAMIKEIRVLGRTHK